MDYHMYNIIVGITNGCENTYFKMHKNGDGGTEDC